MNAFIVIISIIATFIVCGRIYSLNTMTYDEYLKEQERYFYNYQLNKRENRNDK